MYLSAGRALALMIWKMKSILIFPCVYIDAKAADDKTNAPSDTPNKDAKQAESAKSKIGEAEKSKVAQDQDMTKLSEEANKGICIQRMYSS